MHADMSYLSLITDASLIVKIVMLLLLLASIGAWTVIIKKRVQIQLAVKQANEFEKAFWSGGELQNLYKEYIDQKNLTGMPGIFVAGFKEFSRAQAQKSKGEVRNLEDSMRNISRVMNVALAKEMDRLEAQLPFLATVGSTSPYVGLFGTVWGIMNSFRALGSVKQATLAMVAPGIAEALIATAMGLFAAIPAVISYNGTSTRLARLETRYDNFLEEFTHVLERHLSSQNGGND
jgi:biopolymer transport protein TolQ